MARTRIGENEENVARKRNCCGWPSGARSLAISSLAISLINYQPHLLSASFTISLIYYQPNLLSPYLLSIHWLSVSRALGLTCTQASLALTTLSIRSICYSASLAIKTCSLDSFCVEQLPLCIRSCISGTCRL